ncbi:MAG: ABC transporter permease [Betaproteobacteria bacterium]|nr:ABC transporter permease [Betaproteobacteria bacterium]
MSRTRFLLIRIVKAAVVVFAIAVANFFLVRMAPGDPAQVLAGQSGAADEKYLAQLRQQFGLDQPMHTQFVIHMSNTARLDLGYSHRQQQPVAQLIAERLPATLLLTGCAFALSISAGVMLGVWSARKVGTWTDSAITTGALLFYATPIFWAGLLLVLVFSVQLEWLPAYGMSTIGGSLAGAGLVLDVARHAVLPVLTLSLFYMAIYARLTRASMLEVSQMDFVKTARAKGLTEHEVMYRHVLRNALLPVITYAGIHAGGLVGGSIVVETIFAWPGIGRLAFEAVSQRDYSVLLGIFLVISILVVIINLLTDLLYAAVDPRIELK